MKIGEADRLAARRRGRVATDETPDVIGGDKRVLNSAQLVGNRLVIGYERKRNAENRSPGRAYF